MDEADEHFPTPAIVRERFPNAFLLRVEGEYVNRMLPNGCVALIDPSTDFDHEGQPYAVCVNKMAATIKRMRHTARGIELVLDSTDPSHQTQVLTRGIDDMTVSVIGRVVWHHLPEGQGR